MDATVLLLFRIISAAIAALSARALVGTIGASPGEAFSLPGLSVRLTLRRYRLLTFLGMVAGLALFVGSFAIAST